MVDAPAQSWLHLLRCTAPATGTNGCAQGLPRSDLQTEPVSSGGHNPGAFWVASKQISGSLLAVFVVMCIVIMRYYAFGM